jgi:coenzyme F420-dependent glucose-6-phosphate dehydrogenase
MGERRSVRLGWWLSSEEHDPRQLVEQARIAEETGFCTAMISDHLQPWVRRQAHAANVWSTLGAISQATDELEVGTGVTAMVHRSTPLNVAQAAATAAVLLGGRFFLGVGTGERLNEQPTGLRWPRAGERRRRMAEGIDLVRSLWAGDNVNHQGEFWTVENLRLATRPAEPPAIYVAASGARSAVVAGELGDGLIGVVPDARVVEVFHGAGGGGKPCLAQVHVSLAHDVDGALANAREWWPIAAVPPELLAELARPKDFEAVAAVAGDRLLRTSVVLAVDAEPVIERIDRFVGAGFDTVYLHQIGPDQRRLADLARTELLPHYALGR